MTNLTSELPVQAAQKDLTITDVLKKMPGGSGGYLARCSDSRLYVVKFPGWHGPNLLANEWLGSHLLKGLGLLTPPSRTVAIAATPGGRGAVLGFASEFVGGLDTEICYWLPDTRRHMVRNATHLHDVALFDLWANHHDLRQYAYHFCEAGDSVEAFAIDNGHLFGGTKWEMTETRMSLHAWHSVHHSFVDSYLEGRIRRLKCLLPRLLQSAIASTPAQWLPENVGYLEDHLLARLERLDSLCDNDICYKVSGRRSLRQQITRLATAGSAPLEDVDAGKLPSSKWEELLTLNLSAYEEQVLRP